MLGGGGSIQLARLFGIRIGASPSWFLVLFLLIYSLTGRFERVAGAEGSAAFGLAVAAAFAFFGSLVLHELGHALAARRFGIGIRGIELWFFGGIASMERDTRTPKEELVVASAGPIGTALCLLASVVAGVLITDGSEFWDALRFADVETTEATAVLAWLSFVNAFILVFNLIPAFPLDGGRIARGIAWAVTGDRTRATRASGRVGQLFAGLVIGFGLFMLLAGIDVFGGALLAVMGWFLLQAARSAVIASDFSERIEGVTAADLMDDEPVTVPAATSALAAQDEFFLRYRHPWFMVVDDGGRFLGVVDEARVDGAVASGQPALPVADLLDRGADNDWRVPRDLPLESLLTHEPLRRLGAVAVVDTDERLLGVLTADSVRRALVASAAD